MTIDNLKRLAEEALPEWQANRPFLKVGDDAVIGPWLIALADAWPSILARLEAAENLASAVSLVLERLAPLKGGEHTSALREAYAAWHSRTEGSAAGKEPSE